MEGEVGPTATTSPPPEYGSTPLGSPEETPDEVQSLSSGEDHDHDAELVPHEHDVDHDDEDHHSLSDLAVQTDDIKQKIIKQVEYYFSDENLPTDKYMISLIKKNKEGFVPLKIIASFRKMKKLTLDHELISAALNESSLLVVSPDGKKVKRLKPFQMSEIQDPQLFTVLVENLPEDHSLENIRRIFGEAGRIKKITFGDPHAGGVLKKGNKTDILISSKLHAIVEYDTEEAAEKAVASFNNEQDWRNGMHVKRLKRVGKPTQKKTWKDHDIEKSSCARVSNQTVDEDVHHSQDHHDLLPDEEDAELVSRDKNGHRGGRNKGRCQRNRYHNSNGLGHGTTSSAHAVEPSKPPPGPKMPDGTRGFAMGRGRPPQSAND